jgi:hypothetical protein
MTRSMRRLSPPPVCNPRNGDPYCCPLCAERLDHHTQLGRRAAFTCGSCSAFWLESDVIRSRAGEWDDSDEVCGVSGSLNLHGEPIRVTCVLGAEHGDNQQTRVHISYEGHQWR